jgi:hypothetical protein
MIAPARQRRASPVRQMPEGELCARAGAALLEGTIVLAVFLTIIFAMFDLGLAVMRQNSLAEAARRLARTAIVHGDLAPPEHTAWGPLEYTGTADEDHEIADAVRAGLVTMNPADVSINVTWPDGDNRTSDRVIVAVEYPHRTILPYLFGGSALNLRAESTMRIEH